jgi:hypothetical protein
MKNTNNSPFALAMEILEKKVILPVCVSKRKIKFSETIKLLAK